MGAGWFPMMEQKISPNKLNPPQHSRALNRQRLFHLLDRCLEHPVTWISGPAGAGKTTLVLSYLKARGLTPLWYQVDESDCDLASFFSHLSLLTKQHAPPPSRLPPLTAEYLHGIPVFTRNFAEQFYQHLPAGSVLVFDNYQDAGPKNPLDALLPDLLDTIPPHLHILFLSRRIPPDTLSHLLDNAHVQSINWQHLQFTEEEIHDLVELQDSRPSFSRNEIANLHESTQGWAASLVLMLEHPFDKAQHLINEGHSRERIFEYYANELFHSADGNVKEFLLKTAVLQNIDAEIATAVTGNPESRKILEDLAQRNYFIFKQTGTPDNFQIHPLFRDFLLDTAKQSLGEQLARIQRHAADILMERGDILHAAELWHQAEDWDKLLDLILQHGQTLIDRGHFNTLKHWIGLLPDDIRSAHYWLYYWQGLIEIAIKPASAIGYFTSAYQLSQSQSDPLAQVLSWCGAVHAYTYSWGEVASLDGWIADLETILELTEKIADPELQEQVDYAAYLALMYRQPQHDRMKDYADKVWNIILDGHCFQTRIKAASQLLFYFVWWSGDFDKADILVQTMQKKLEHPDAPPLVKITWHSMLSCYYDTAFNSDACDKSIRTGLSLSDQTGIYIWKAWLYVKGCLLNLQKGDLDQSAGFLEQLQLAIHPEDLTNQAIYYHFRAWYHLLENNIEGVRENVLIACRLSRRAGNVIIDIMTHIGYAKYLIHTGETRKALDLLHRLRKKALQMNARPMAFLSYIPEVDYLLKSGQRDRGIDLLRDMFTTTRTYSAIWWSDEEFSRFCALALQYDINPVYVRQIIARHRLRPPADQYTDQWPYPVKIYTLGRFRLLLNDSPIQFSGKVQKKPLELLKTLLALGGRDVREELLTDALWPDASGDAAHDSLRTTIMRVRKLLNIKEAIHFKEGKVSLDPEHCWVDCWSFERMSNISEFKGPALDYALGLYHNHFLPDEPDSYPVLSMRERLRNKFVRTIQGLGAQYENDDLWDKAIEIYRQGLEVDDLAEIFYQGLMRCHHKLGQQSETEKIYRHCHNLLNEKLGLAPSSGTRQLYQQLSGSSRFN